MTSFHPVPCFNTKSQHNHGGLLQWQVYIPLGRLGSAFLHPVMVFGKAEGQVSEYHWILWPFSTSRKPVPDQNISTAWSNFLCNFQSHFLSRLL